jgi:type IV pilus assembly protein PilB
MGRKRLGELLLEAGVIDSMQLDSALGEQQKWGRPLGQTLVELGFIDERELVRALSTQLLFPTVDLRNSKAPMEALNRLDFEFCVAHSCFPFGYQENGSFLDVAMADPTNPTLFDTIRVQTRCNIRPHIAGLHDIETAIRRDYLGEMPSSEAPKVDNRPFLTRPDEVMFEGRRASNRPLSLEEDRDLPDLPPRRRPQPPRQAHEEPPPKPVPDLPPQPESPPEPPRRMKRAPTEERPPLASSARDQLLMQLHETVRQLVANLERDEKVLRKLMMLLVEKGVCTRAELVAKIYEE